MPHDPLAVADDRPLPPPGDLTLRLPAHPESVATGRRFVVEVLAGAPDEHVWAVVQCTSELLTNALAAAGRYATERRIDLSGLDAPVCLTVHATPRWTRIDVRDPETRLHPVRARTLLAEEGRGIEIVTALGHFAHTIFADHKVVHALIPIDGRLGDEERTAAFSHGPAVEVRESAT